ncbi:MAG TPA: RnfH family protein [Burkholderiales bacterium]|jgi:putative ubiquitin-RnfH superfamily antitoxin RatB of RatAB toxin-antitoxin module|nr:RnfH family protein [Burkholderiales bacterium]
MALEQTIDVEVVYVRPDKQVVVALSVPAGTTVREAVDRAVAQTGLAELQHAPVGIYGKLVAGAVVLRDGDRVEIYRPLMADAKQARRRRATRALK